MWPDVAARLTRVLRRRGVDAATAEDVVQETAVRVLRTGVPYADGDDLLRWASVVGWRLAVDTRRKDRRAEPGPVPDRQSSVNVALAVEQRTALEAVGRGLRLLSPSDRSAILDPLHGTDAEVTRQQAAVAAVRRHRARNRLLLMTRGLLGALGVLAARRRGAVPRSGVVAAIGAPAALVAFVLVPSVGPAPDVRLPVPAGAGIAPAAPATTQLPAVAPAPPPSPPAPAGGAVATARPPAAPAAPQAAEPVVEVAVPDPLGGTTTIGARPRQPDDHTLCVELPGLPLPCIDVLPPPPLG